MVYINVIAALLTKILDVISPLKCFNGSRHFRRNTGNYLDGNITEPFSFL